MTFTRSNDINALVSGDIQFDQTSPDEVIHSALGGFPVRMIMATTRGLNLALAVQPAIKSAAELKGKSVAVTSFSGLGMSKDQVVPLDVGGKSARLEALLHGRVAAAILDPPYTTIATKAGYKLLVDLAPLDVPYLRNVVAVSQKALREDSATIARFVEALSEGMRYYRDQTNREESLRILAKYLRVPLETNRAMLEEGYETYRDMLLRKPYADPGAMKILSRSDWRLQPQSAQFESRIAHRFLFCRAPRPAGILRQLDASGARHPNRLTDSRRFYSAATDVDPYGNL